MQINIQIDADKLIAETLRQQKRLVYNTVTALNKTALAAQAAIRQDMASHFTLRSATRKQKAWLLQQIKVKFASVKKGVIYAEVYIDAKPRLLLASFETGETRTPFVGKNVARPVSGAAREGGTQSGAVKQEMTFRALRFKPVLTYAGGRRREGQPLLQGPGNVTQFKGLQRTFILKATAKHPLGGVFQRVGPKRDDIRMVYSFARAYRLKRLLHFFATARRTFNDKFAVEMSIASARDTGRPA